MILVSLFSLVIAEIIITNETTSDSRSISSLVSLTFLTLSR